jgi:hypothetical protein
MLVPLQGTLPGWPQANEPTALEVLGLLIGLPAVAFIIIAILGKSPDLVRAGRGQSANTTDEPLWLGAAPADRAALTAGDTAPVPAGGRRGITGSSDSAAVGGASARW